MASIQWIWDWANPGRWWRSGKPDVLPFMGSQIVGHDSATEQQNPKFAIPLLGDSQKFCLVSQHFISCLQTIRYLKVKNDTSRSPLYVSFFPLQWPHKSYLPWDLSFLIFVSLAPREYQNLYSASSHFSLVQLLSHVWFFVTPWTATHRASLSFTISLRLLKLTSTELVMPSNHPVLCIPFSSCLQSFPASGSFQMSQFFTSGGQSIGVSASASVLPMTIQDWFLLGWTGWISLQSNGLSSLLQNHSSKASSHLVHYFVFTFSALGSNFWSRKHLQEKSLSQCEVQQCILFLLSSFGQASFNFLGNSQMIPKKSIFLYFIQLCSWWTVCLI